MAYSLALARANLKTILPGDPGIDWFVGRISHIELSRGREPIVTPASADKQRIHRKILEQCVAMEHQPTLPTQSGSSLEARLAALAMANEFAELTGIDPKIEKQNWQTIAGEDPNSTERLQLSSILVCI